MSLASRGGMTRPRNARPRRVSTMRAGARRAVDLEPAQADAANRVVAPLLQNQMRPLARRGDVLLQVDEVDLPPDRACLLHCFAVRERRIPVEVRFRVAEHGLAQGEEPFDVP